MNPAMMQAAFAEGANPSKYVPPHMLVKGKILKEENLHVLTIHRDNIHEGVTITAGPAWAMTVEAEEEEGDTNGIAQTGMVAMEVMVISNRVLEEWTIEVDSGVTNHLVQVVVVDAGIT
jgi:hypothetical protein